MKCHRCEHEIGSDRLEALPETKECVECSTFRAPLVLMDYAHKTAGYPVVVDRNGVLGNEAERLAIRCYRRSR
jgi:hypothetical protein